MYGELGGTSLGSPCSNGLSLKIPELTVRLRLDILFLHWSRYDVEVDMEPVVSGRLPCSDATYLAVQAKLQPDIGMFLNTWMTKEVQDCASVVVL